MECSLVTDTDEVATSTAGVVAGLRAFMMLRHAADAELMSVLNGLSTTADGRAVTKSSG